MTGSWFGTCFIFHNMIIIILRMGRTFFPRVPLSFQNLSLVEPEAQNEALMAALSEAL